MKIHIGLLPISQRFFSPHRSLSLCTDTHSDTQTHLKTRRQEQKTKNVHLTNDSVGVAKQRHRHGYRPNTTVEHWNKVVSAMPFPLFRTAGKMCASRRYSAIVRREDDAHGENNAWHVDSTVRRRSTSADCDDRLSNA